MQLEVDARTDACVARQPILTAAGRVFGYELLYRTAAEATSCDGPSDTAGARVLNDAVVTMGLETLTGGRRAFMNLTRHMLLAGFATLLPPDGVVIELLENTDVDEEVVEACRRLKGLGYAIALDDYTVGSPADALLPFVKYVKIDVLATAPEQWRALKPALPATVQLIAEKVETAEVFGQAREAGYHLFQGYYFCRPTTITGGAMSSRRLAYAQLLATLNRRDVSVGQVEDLIKHDASLSFRVLRCVNSAAFGMRREIQSIRQALVLLGLEQIRKWASVWAMAGLNTGNTEELVTVAVLRARSCELLAQEVLGADAAPEYFLLGLCSLLDAMVGRPMPEAIAELPLSAVVHKALLGETNRARVLLDAVIAYERGMWDVADTISSTAGITQGQLTSVYANALKWARELSNATAAAA